MYKWAINRYTDGAADDKEKIFYTNGLMRMRLTEDGGKMVIATMNSYLMIVHDLNLDTMARDLEYFKVR